MDQGGKLMLKERRVMEVCLGRAGSGWGGERGRDPSDPAPNSAALVPLAQPLAHGSLWVVTVELHPQMLQGFLNPVSIRPVQRPPEHIPSVHLAQACPQLVDANLLTW